LRWVKIDSKEEEGMGVFNGDMGIITKIDNEDQKVVVMFDDDKLSEYDFNILDELEPAYAITIHKSQGSEFPAIVIPVFPGPQVLMTRNLVYTAVTRAKSLVVIVGSENTLKAMVENDREALRYSGLEEKLKLYLI
jgi:exodeoxyribonuclease V alpha subunit